MTDARSENVLNVPETLEALGPPTIPLLKRVIAGSDDNVIHSFIFEFVNGERRGFCLDENNEPLSILDDANIEGRVGNNWIDIKCGDYIVGINGFNLNGGQFLCHSVTLLLKSGNQVPFTSTKKTFKGTPFTYTVPRGLVTNLVFLFGNLHAIGIKTTSIHLPLTKENIKLLPKEHKQSILTLFLIFKRVLVVDNHCHNVNLMLPYEVGWKIIGYISGYDVHHEG